MTLYGKRCGPDWSFRRCFCSRKRCVRLWRCDVRKYTADAILFRSIQCKKMDNLMFEQRFQCELGWNKAKYARITITHVCFIALTLAGSLGWCWKLGLSASCSNSILGTRQMLMHEKTCVIPIIYHIFGIQCLIYSFRHRRMLRCTRVRAVDVTLLQQLLKVRTAYLLLARICPNYYFYSDDF